jgi:hypothetical protein
MISNPGRVSPAAFSAVHLLFHLKMRIIINFRNLGPRQDRRRRILGRRLSGHTVYSVSVTELYGTAAYAVNEKVGAGVTVLE